MVSNPLSDSLGLGLRGLPGEMSEASLPQITGFGSVLPALGRSLRRGVRVLGARTCWGPPNRDSTSSLAELADRVYHRSRKCLSWAAAVVPN